MASTSTRAERRNICERFVLFRAAGSSPAGRELRLNPRHHNSRKAAQTAKRALPTATVRTIAFSNSALVPCEVRMKDTADDSKRCGDGQGPWGPCTLSVSKIHQEVTRLIYCDPSIELFTSALTARFQEWIRNCFIVYRTGRHIDG